MLLVACEDLIQSAGIIIRESQLDPDLVGPCKSIIYACGRIEAPELDRVRDQLVTKFGSAVGDVTSEEGRASVDSSLIVKLSIRNPDLNLSYKYMAAIAECYGISWKPSSCNLTTSNILINEVNGPALNSNWSVEQKKTLLNSNLDQSIPVVGGQSPPLSNANDDSPTDQDVRHADNPPPYSPSHSEMTPPPHNNTLESRSTSAPSFEELSERLKALKRR